MFVFASISFAILLRFCLARENKKLEAIETEQTITENSEKGGMSHDEIVLDGVGGLLVLNPGFRYIL